MTYMVSVQVLDQSHNIDTQSVDEGSDLFLLTRTGEEVDHLLDSTGTVHVQADTDELARHRLDDGGSLFLG